MVISVKERSIFKYWIFRRESIPEGGELLEMYLNKAAIDATALANSGTAFQSAEYWTSHQLASSVAEMRNMGTGAINIFQKGAIREVRPIRTFIGP